MVEIPDIKLKEAINKTLGNDRKIDAPITVDEMASIKKIDSEMLPYLDMSEALNGDHDRGIRDIKGLEYAINLESLDLSENGIDDVSELSNLTKLTYLEVDRNMLGDLSPLENLQNLEHLSIYNNADIKDLTPISNIKSLKWIDMHYCNRRTSPVNIEKLASLENLEFLSIDDNFVEDISFTKHLPNLTTFSCNNSYVTDIEAMQELAVASYDDWSGERFFNMYGQVLKEDIQVEVDSEETVYKFKNPVKNIGAYQEKVEQVAKSYGDDSVKAPALECELPDYVNSSYNYDTDEIELTINKNDGDNKRSDKAIVNLNYGMYSLKIMFDITQEIK